MNDRIILFRIVPFPQGKISSMRSHAWDLQKRAKTPKIYPEPGRRKIGIYKSRQHKADNSWLCQPHLAPIQDRLASLAVADGRDRQEANCPEAGQFWWKKVGGKRGNWVIRPQALSMVQRK